MGRKATHIPQKYRFAKLQDTFQERKIQDLIKHNCNNRICYQDPGPDLKSLDLNL